MKILWRTAKDTVQYRSLYIVAIISTICLTLLNLIAPRMLTQMTALVAAGVDEAVLNIILRLAFGLLGLYLLRILFRYLSNFLAHKAAWHLVEKMRMRVYDHMQSFSMGFFHDKQTGELMSRVVNDTATFELLYAHILPELLTNITTMIGVTIILFSINAKLALLTCIPIPLILFSGWIFSTRVRPNFRKMQKALATLNAQLQDNLSGIQEIQAFGQEEYEHTRVQSKAALYTQNMLRALNLSAVFHPGVEFLTSLGTVLVVGFGGYLAFRSQLSVSDIVGFILYLSLFYAPITGLARLMEDLQHGMVGAERVYEILDTPSQIQDLLGAYPAPALAGEITFEQVSFNYIKDIPVLEDISFHAKPGEMIALVGPTGVGKTTLVQLLARFYDPVQGSVKVDGMDLRDLTLESLRSQIAMVLQDTFLFNGTVAENISYANAHASREELLEAAQIARIHEDIMAMPDQYETQVGERGTKLSGGQKQRIAIARAVLRKAPILILDEATASVDVETEMHIQQAIQQLAGTRTIIAIAHRLSTVRRADQILVLEDGCIVQRGNHESLLLESGGLYARLCQAQQEGYLSQGDIA